MKGAHVAGGGIGAILGAVLAAGLRKYVGWEVSDMDASLIGSAALGAGVALGHLVSDEGIVPALRRLVYGPPSKGVSSKPWPSSSSEPPPQQ